MPRSEDLLVARLPSFRRRGLGGPPSIPTKTWRSRNLVCRQGREDGESAGGQREGRRWPLVVRRAPRTGRWTSSFPVSRKRDAWRLTQRRSRSAVGRHARCGNERLIPTSRGDRSGGARRYEAGVPHKEACSRGGNQTARSSGQVERILFRRVVCPGP